VTEAVVMMRTIGGVALALSALALAGSAVGAPAPQRLDPYKNFKFRLVFEGRTVAGVGRMRPATPPAEYRQGGAGGPRVRKGGGRDQYEPITLERGLTLDNEFASWAAQVWSSGVMAPASARRAVTIQLTNEAGQTVVTWRFAGCWTAQSRVLPNLDQGANAIAIEHIKIECEGWTRDPSVSEPQP
jgi:phage tail-like protein